MCPYGVNDAQALRENAAGAVGTEPHRGLDHISGWAREASKSCVLTNKNDLEKSFEKS